jgi:hypothetical protein
MTTNDLTREDIDAILAKAEAREDRRPVVALPVIPESDYCPDCGWYLPGGDHGAC